VRFPRAAAAQARRLLHAEYHGPILLSPATTEGKTYGDSETELLAGVCGPTPTDIVLTWAKAKKLLHITA
jgi:hypothetical protein